MFVANPDAPISDVAKHAGVGISALYRRHPSKDDLLRQTAECNDAVAPYDSS